MSQIEVAKIAHQQRVSVANIDGPGFCVQTIGEGFAQGVNAATWTYPGLKNVHVVAGLKQFVGSYEPGYSGTHDDNFLRIRCSSYARKAREDGRCPESSRTSDKFSTLQQESPFALPDVLDPWGTFPG